MFVHLEPARPTPEDAELVLRWRNDPETLRSFYHSTPKAMPAFLEEFRAQYFQDPELAPVFACFRGERIGFARFEPYPEDLRPDRGSGRGPAIALSVNLRPEARGRGLGTAFIGRCAEHLFERGVDCIVAEIRRDNVRSVRAFERAGFRFHDEFLRRLEDTREEVPVFRLTLRREPPQHAAPRPVFIVAEAGSNFRSGTPERDLAMARTLIDVAAEAGADAVKFQTYRPETVYVENAGEAEYLAQAGPITEIFRDLSMPHAMLPELAEHCARRGIEFLSTPFSVPDAEAVDPHVRRHKLASYEISHAPLLEWLARSGKPLLLSTGSATLEDIAWAVHHFHRHGGRELTLLQCTARYPAPLSTLNLAAIPALRARFGVPVGLSDHSRDPVIGPVGAVALGATVIEKHFTLHNRLPGPDHSFALTPEELRRMVEAVRAAEQARGSSAKTILPEEEELYGFARRGVQCIAPLRAGDRFELGKNVAILRPGRQRRGVHPRHLPDLLGRPATRAIAPGDGVQVGDWSAAAPPEAAR